MFNKLLLRIITTCTLAFTFIAMSHADTVGIFFDSSVEQIEFAAGDVKTALERIY